ncbi:hypothetical protein LCGC14_2798910 [marine sediment metagenome]|uniref:Uncharacterized protein n=1 Tax=marine sediment metagenome TaxID=412755 RepID=A0A0F9BEP5_9ZZZZ
MAGRRVKLLDVANGNTFLVKVHNVALARLQAKLPLDVRKEWQGESREDENRVNKSLEITLTHTCGYRVVHRRVFPKGTTSMVEARAGGNIFADLIYMDVIKHKCSDKEVPHLKIVKPWLCPICGVTDEKYPEWEGVCNHASNKAKSKDKRVRERIGGRKGPAKARRKAVAKASRGDEDLCEQR